MPARLILSALWFFLVLFSYYVLKPVRDALATETRLFGPLYLATFLAVCAALPLYWRIVARTTRWQLVFGVYQFFVACLVVFAVLLARGHGDAAWLRNAFFVWVSVFNLYVVAVFWSVMADLFSAEEGKTWFGAVAAAGTSGSIVASLVGARRRGTVGRGLADGSRDRRPRVIDRDGVAGLAIRVPRRRRRLSRAVASSEPPSSGSLLAGLRTVLASRYLLMICAFTAIGKFAATFVYNNFQHALREEAGGRRANGIVFGDELLLPKRHARVPGRPGGGADAARRRRRDARRRLRRDRRPVRVAAVRRGFWPLMVAKVVQEIVGYGLLVPAQQVLFTVVSRAEKYESKAFVDTVVFRGSDVAAANVCDALGRFSVSAAALAILPLVGVWMALGAWLGREQTARSQANADRPEGGQRRRDSAKLKPFPHRGSRRE